MQKFVTSPAAFLEVSREALWTAVAPATALGRTAHRAKSVGGFAAADTSHRQLDRGHHTTLVFGCITRNASWCGKPLHNAAIVARRGKVILEQHKSLLPTYGAFDELPQRSTCLRVDPAGREKRVSVAPSCADSLVGIRIVDDYAGITPS
jgi:hypothetical protein